MKKLCCLLRRKLLCLLASAGLTRSFKDRLKLIDFLLKEASLHARAQCYWLELITLQDCEAELDALKRWGYCA